MSLSIVILAAGQGKRMNSDLPKVLQPLAGRPLLGHVLDCAHRLAPSSTYVVYGHGGEQVRAAFPDASIQWVLQAEQKGTGHALLQAIPAIPDDDLVLVLYGDVPLIHSDTLTQLIAQAGTRSLALLSVILSNPVGYGRVLRDNAHHVYRIVEQKEATRKEQGVQECNTGVMVAPAGALKRWLSGIKNNNTQEEYYLTDIVAVAVRDGFTVHALVAPTEAEVLGVNDKRQLAALESAYRQSQATALMSAGVTIIDPTRIDVRGEVSVGRDVTLDVNVVLEGQVQLGHRVIVGAGGLLKNVTIGDDTVLRPYSVLEQATVGAHCVVGPYARLRPGTTLADHAHVGNFVEIKNSTLGAGSKANHLSYVGDATVGQDVNIGAGTITCNYDGANKWPTTIEDGAFIGSGTMLVAPITVGKNATIAAGSTITQSTPPDQLTVERSEQKSLSHWRRPTKATEEVRAARIAKGGPVTKKKPSDA